jgi:hypothetical protein
MNPTLQANDELAPSRVSILARLVPSFSYAIPMLGAALSALFLLGIIRTVRYAEAAGIAAVAGGMAEANLAVVVALYLAIFVGFIGILVMVIRSFMSTTTASPAAWFFMITGIISLIPMILLWEAQSLLVAAISPGGGGIVHFVSNIRLYLSLTLVASAVLVLILLIASLIPLPKVLRSKRNWAPLIVLVLMELALIGMAVAFQVRTSWLHQVKEMERVF